MLLSWVAWSSFGLINSYCFGQWMGFSNMSLPVLCYSCQFCQQLLLDDNFCSPEMFVVSLLKIVNLCTDWNVQNPFCTPVQKVKQAKNIGMGNERWRNILALPAYTKKAI
jgi:hypothetical protein